MSRVSVVVPAYNAQATLSRCLQALLRQSLTPDEIIVIDDGSTDHTAEVAVALGVQCISQINKGKSAARNQGVKAASGDIVLFTDADCEPCPEWIACLLKAFTHNDVVGAKGTYRTHQTSLVARFVQQEHEYKYDRMSRQEYIDFIDTYSAAYRRSVMLEHGGFDERFRGCEDQELSFRLARKGYHLIFVPDAVVIHRHVGTVKEYIKRKFWIGYWKAYLLRWLPEKAFNDSHTPPSQRWQILFLFLAVLSLLVAVFLPTALLLTALWLLALYISTLPMALQIWRRDRPVLAVAPLMLICRAGALGAGLAAGFIVPPKYVQRRGEGLSLLNRPVKRMVDIVGALIGGITSIPVVLLAGLAVRVDSSGPMFYTQVRAGENGKPFHMIKLRTMVDGADKQRDDLANLNPIRGPAFKLPADPRVTRVGRVLRRWSVDELPQFWNVLRGEMSLVGPRPEEFTFVEQYDAQQRKRLVVKPGLTGPAQVAGRGDLNFERRLQLELDYIENYSLLKDVNILVHTVAAIITGRGAY